LKRSANPARWRLFGWLAAVAIVLLSGCALPGGVVRAYRGGALPAAEIAVVRNVAELEVVKVDGMYVSRRRRFGKGLAINRIEVLPGRHTIEVTKTLPEDAFFDSTYNALQRYRVVQAELKLIAEAGKIYILGQEIERSPQYRWTPWVRELGAPPPAAAP
jgi:hypothetical protein